MSAPGTGFSPEHKEESSTATAQKRLQVFWSSPEVLPPARHQLWRGPVPFLLPAPASLPSPGYCNQQTLHGACFINLLLGSCQHGLVLLLAGEELSSVLIPGGAPAGLSAASPMGPCPTSRTWHPGCCTTPLPGPSPGCQGFLRACCVLRNCSESQLRTQRCLLPGSSGRSAPPWDPPWKISSTLISQKHSRKRTPRANRGADGSSLPRGTGRLRCLQPPSPSRQPSDLGKEGRAAWSLGTPGPYQVGGGGRALSALLGGVARAGAEVGAGYATPVEGTEDADGGLARADDEELLPVTGVGGVVPQHLAQVPWKGRAREALAGGDTGTTAVAVPMLLTAGGSEDVLGWGSFGATRTRVGLWQRRQACSKSYLQHCSHEAGEQHRVAKMVREAKAGGRMTVQKKQVQNIP